MDKKSITFVFSRPSISPVGGFKVIYEYANRLSNDGFEVHIVYDMFYSYSSMSMSEKFKQVLRYILANTTNHYSGRRWFNLNENIREHYTKSLKYKDICKTDIYVATAAETSFSVNEYPISMENKGYLIQGYENWNLSDIELKRTYHFNLKIMVISNWLKLIMDQEKVRCYILKNGFDFDYFKLTVPIRARSKYVITMLNHSDERKGVKYGIAALNLVKQKYPQIQVNMFGVPPRPSELPDWYHYYQTPDRTLHNKIYNEGAIFLATSLMEGWGLTVGEAMICGEAIVCTEVDGFKEMVKDGISALFSPIKDAQSLACNVIKLIENDEMRIGIAERANKDIKQFNWNASYKEFLNIFDLN